MISVLTALSEIYGSQRWWPRDTPFEDMVGAILTQNTAWHNVALAISDLKSENLLEPRALLMAEPEKVKALIRPSGFFNVKYIRLMNFLEYLATYDMDLQRLSCLPLADLRNELLGVKGIGPETADSMLLYAFNRPIFVTDAYTRRLFSRLGYLWMNEASYDRIQATFMRALPPDPKLLNEYHALIVTHCKIKCKSKPLCDSCGLSGLCAFDPKKPGVKSSQTE